MELRLGVKRLLTNLVINAVRQKIDHLSDAYPIYVDDVIVERAHGVRFRYGRLWAEFLIEDLSDSNGNFPMSFRFMKNRRINERTIPFKVCVAERNNLRNFSGYISQTLFEFFFGVDAAKNIPHTHFEEEQA